MTHGWIILTFMIKPHTFAWCSHVHDQAMLCCTVFSCSWSSSPALHGVRSKLLFPKTFPCPAAFDLSKQSKILSSRSHDFLLVTKIKTNREVDLPFGKGEIFGKAPNFLSYFKFRKKISKILTITVDCCRPYHLSAAWTKVDLNKFYSSFVVRLSLK